MFRQPSERIKRHLAMPFSNVHRESEQGGPKRGGGLAVIHRDSLVVVRRLCTAGAIKANHIRTGASSLIFANIYRPPSQFVNAFFFDESVMIKHKGSHASQATQAKVCRRVAGVGLWPASGAAAVGDTRLIRRTCDCIIDQMIKSITHCMAHNAKA